MSMAASVPVTDLMPLPDIQLHAIAAGVVYLLVTGALALPGFVACISGSPLGNELRECNIAD